MTDDERRARFHALGREREEILARSMPVRAKRDKLASDAREKESRLVAEIKAIEAGLYDIDQERAAISRSLGGRTG